MGDDSLFDGAPDRPDDVAIRGGLAARIEVHEDRADQCTIFPADADDELLVTRWITAEEGSYVSLATMR